MNLDLNAATVLPSAIWTNIEHSDEEKKLYHTAPALAALQSLTLAHPRPPRREWGRLIVATGFCIFLTTPSPSHCVWIPFKLN